MDKIKSGKIATLNDIDEMVVNLSPQIRNEVTP